MPRTLDYFMKRNIIVVVDIETTGFSHKRDCIVEIGICELDLDTGKCKKLFDRLILEEHLSSRHIDEWIFENSNLEFEDVLKAKPLESYREEIQRIFNKYLATAFNKRFDFDYLKDRGFKINELPCPMIKATNILKLPPKKPNTLYKWPSVEEAWVYYHPDIKYIEQHRAYDDAVHEALIVFEMFKKGHWKPIEE
ncbi:MAG: 3'-5' exonuclease [Promethearchaeota archaeon]